MPFSVRVPGSCPPVAVELAVVSHENPESTANQAMRLPFLASSHHVLIVCASLTVTHQLPLHAWHKTSRSIFGNVVEQKRNGLGDTRRSKLGRPSHSYPENSIGWRSSIHAGLPEGGLHNCESSHSVLFISSLRVRSRNKLLL